MYRYGYDDVFDYETSMSVLKQRQYFNRQLDLVWPVQYPLTFPLKHIPRSKGWPDGCRSV